MKMTNRTVLITGGTGGIGSEMSKQLLERGNVVIVTGRDEARLDHARHALPGLHTIKSDAGDSVAIRELHDRLIKQFPRLDTIVNNAGIMRNLKLQNDRPLVDLTREIEVGINGPMWMIQQFLGHLQTRPNALIVNVSSGLAFVPFPAAPIYCAAKAALHAYSKCLRVQLESTSVSVIELAPPGTETPLFRAEFEKEMKREKGMPPALLVHQAIKAIEAGKFEIRPGVSNVLAIASRVAPHFMFKQMIKLSHLTPVAA